MWRHIYAVIVWVVGADEPMQWRPPVMPAVDRTPPRPSPPRRTVAQIDADLHAEQVVWEYERRAGRDTTASLAACGRIDELLEERSVALQRVRQPQSGAVAGPAV